MGSGSSLSVAAAESVTSKSMKIELILKALRFYLKWFQNLRSGSRARRRSIEKAQSRRWRDEPSKERPATQPLRLRWGFETTSK
jgi:hypothetical protein